MKYEISNVYFIFQVMDPAWYNKTFRHQEEERNLVNSEIFQREATSRLACCVRVEPFMKEMQIRLGDIQDYEDEDTTANPWWRY